MDENNFYNASQENTIDPSAAHEAYTDTPPSFFAKHKAKIITAIALVLTAVIAFSAGCFLGPNLTNNGLSFSDEKPELNMKSAKKALKDADYDVYLYEDDLEFGMVKRLRADNDDDDGLYIIEYEDEELAKMAYEETRAQIIYSFTVAKISADNVEHILAEYEDTLTSKQSDDYKQKLKDYKKQLKKFNEEFVLGRDGCIVWYGTKTAIEDSFGD